MNGAWQTVIPVALVAAASAVADRASEPVAGGGGQPLQETVRVVERAYLRVGLTVTVTDRRGRPVRGLKRDDFRVFEDGRRIDLDGFGIESERRDRPLSVAILLDLSGSMGSQVGRVEEAARALLARLRAQDEIMIAKFNDQITVLQPFTGDLSGSVRSLKNIGRARGGTNLFRSIEDTLKDLRKRDGRKIVVVVSDGLDNRVARDGHILQSLYLQDLLRLCFRTQTIVYGVRPGMAISSWLPFESFVTETGGRLLYSGGDLERLFGELGEEFQSQYYLGYDIDPKQHEGKRRRIRVELSRPGVFINAMRGYMTPRSGLETLLRELDDRDPGVRRDAAYELGFVRDSRAEAGLASALRDRDGEVRRSALEALARHRTPGTIQRFIERLSDRNESVRQAAGEGLVRFGLPALPAVIHEVNDGIGRRRARSGLLGAAAVAGRIGDERAIQPLESLLLDGPPDARATAARALGDLGLSRGIPPLRAALTNEDPSVRAAALRAIGAIAGPAAGAVVEDHLRREIDPGVRSVARRLLESY